MKLSNPCVIFCGGKSSRMGKDKSLLPFGDFSSLSEYQYNRLSKIFDKVYISTKVDKFSFQAPLIIDNFEDFAPTPALLNILENFDDDFITVISVDTPFISFETLKLLNCKALSGNYGAVVPKIGDEIEPLCAIYSKNIIFTLKELVLKREYKLKNLLNNINTKYVDIDNKRKKEFLNLNHESDYFLALNILNSLNDF